MNYSDLQAFFQSAYPAMKMVYNFDTTCHIQYILVLPKLPLPGAILPKPTCMVLCNQVHIKSDTLDKYMPIDLYQIEASWDDMLKWINSK